MVQPATGEGVLAGLSDLGENGRSTYRNVVRKPLGLVPAVCQESVPAMFTDQIEKMKREYTDKLVLVDASRPELARFRDVVGRVKTVNMNGRALVEFDEYHVNIGWYDIDPAFLKVVDAPPPKPVKTEVKKAPPKAAPAAKAKPAAKAAPAAGAPKAGRMSVAEMMAAARGGGAAGAAPTKAKSEAAPAEAAAEESAPAPVVAKKAASGGKVDKSKMTIDQMVAWCREHDSK